jgi:hypothetical protein
MRTHEPFEIVPLELAMKRLASSLRASFTKSPKRGRWVSHRGRIRPDAECLEGRALLAATSLSAVLPGITSQVQPAGLAAQASSTATHAVVVTQPGNITAGKPITLKVQAENSANQAVVFNGTVTVSVGTHPTGGGTLVGTLGLTETSSGVITLTGLTLNQAGSYNLKVTLTGLPSVTTNTFTVSGGGGGTTSKATHVVIVTQPGNISVGSPITLQVEAEDASNKPVPFSGTVTVAKASGPASIHLAGTLSLTAANNVTTLTGLTFNQVGSGFSLQITLKGLPSVTTKTFSVTTAKAGTLIWTNADPGHPFWDVPANWNLGRVPINGDTLIFPTGKTAIDTKGTATSLKAIEITTSNFSLSWSGNENLTVGSIMFTGSANQITLPFQTTITGNIVDAGVKGPTLGDGLFYNSLTANSAKITGDSLLQVSTGNLMILGAVGNSVNTPVFTGSGTLTIQGPGWVEYGEDFNDYNTCTTILQSGALYIGVLNSGFAPPKWGSMVVEGGTLGTNPFVQDQPNLLQTLTLDGDSSFGAVPGANFGIAAAVTVTGVTTLEGNDHVLLNGGGIYTFKGGFAGSGHVTFSGSGTVFILKQFAGKVSVASGSAVTINEI